MAITLLFGNQFVEEVDPDLLAALRDSPETIGELLATSWTRAQATAT